MPGYRRKSHAEHRVRCAPYSGKHSPQRTPGKGKGKDGKTEYGSR